MTPFFSWLREVFSEDGQGSFCRVAQGLIVAATLGWISYLVVRTNTMPDLGGPSLFIATGAAGHYGINKMESIVTAFKGNGKDKEKESDH